MTISGTHLDPIRRACALLATGLVAGSAGAATLSYEITVSDPASGVVDVSFTMDEYPYDTCELLLADPPMDATEYFTFVEGERFAGRDGAPLVPSRSGNGLVALTGIDGTVTGSFRVLAGELVAAFGHRTSFPVVTDDHLVIPIAAVLPFPTEIGRKGLELTRLEARFRMPEGWELLSPWQSYDGLVTFDTEDGMKRLRVGMIAAGAFDVRNDLELTSPMLRLFTGGETAAADALGRVFDTLTRYYMSVFSTAGDEALCMIVEFEDGPADVDASGPFLRVRCPERFALADPSERVFGSDVYAFHHKLAHELFHRWMGVDGLVVPLGAEVYWLNEGAADYVGALALAATGLAPAESVLSYLGDTIRRYHGLENRAESVSVDASTYYGDADVRRLVLAKGPLICFLLDTQLLRAPDGGHDIGTALRRMFFAAFMRDRTLGAFYSEAELADALNTVLGLRGRLLVSAFVRGDLTDQLPERAGQVGIAFEDGEDGAVAVTLGDGPDALFRRRLAFD